MAVLLGGSLRTSAIWHHGRFKGGIDLWNANAATRTGESLGLAFDKVPAQPRGTILCDSIRRFKGLDREVVVLAELDPDDERLGPAALRWSRHAPANTWSSSRRLGWRNGLATR